MNDKKNFPTINTKEKRCQNWRTEGLLRMLENTLNNGERPEDLIIYGGKGKIARNWDSLFRTMEELKNLKADETLVIQSGKPVAVLKTHVNSPRVLMANSNTVKNWTTMEKFQELEEKELIINGMFTAGSWAYIGTQGILQGTYETFAACAKLHFSGNLKGKIVVTGGMGGMGGAQPLAVKMLDGVCIAIDVNQDNINRRIEEGYCDQLEKDPAKAIKLAKEATDKGEPLTIGLVGNVADVHEEFINQNFLPDIVTDQTSAHDPVNGYIPSGYSISEANKLRETNRDSYIEASKKTMIRQLKSMISFKKSGAIVFEYGNNLRYQVEEFNIKGIEEIPGFVPEYIRPHFAEGRGPFRWICLSGDAEDLAKTDELVIKEFSENKPLTNWIKKAQKNVEIQGLPSRICWLAQGERSYLGKKINQMVKEGKLKGPVAFTRDGLDTGSVTYPDRETEGMLDGSDGISDWPLLNALLNTASGADSVAIHGGAGINSNGLTASIMIIIADGSSEAEERIERCLTNDPGVGVARHVDAGYRSAKVTARKHNINIPMTNQFNQFEGNDS